MFRILLILLFLSSTLLAQQSPNDSSSEPLTDITAADVEVIPENAEQSPDSLDISENQQVTNENDQGACTSCEIEANAIAQDDSDQQKRMADATEHLVVPAWIGAVVSIIALIFLCLTWWQTRVANNIMKTANKQQLRAYMGLSKIVVVPTRNGSKYQLFIKWTNGGQTPAKGTTVASIWQHWEGDSETPREDMGPFLESGQAPLDVPRGAGLSSGTTDDGMLTDGQIELVCRKEISLFVKSRISYSDIFDDPHVDEVFGRVIIESSRGETGGIAYSASFGGVDKPAQ